MSIGFIIVSVGLGMGVSNFLFASTEQAIERTYFQVTALLTVWLMAKSSEWLQ